MMILRYSLVLLLLVSLCGGQVAQRDLSIHEILLNWSRMIREGKNQDFFGSLERDALNIPEYRPPNPPLVEAAWVGNLDVVQGFLKLGAEVDFRNSDGFTALHMAMRENHSEIVSTLLDAKANPYALSHFFTTPLEHSFRHEKSAARDKFLEHARETGQLKRLIDWQLATWETTCTTELDRMELLPRQKAKLERFVPDWDVRNRDQP